MEAWAKAGGEKKKKQRYRGERGRRFEAADEVDRGGGENGEPEIEREKASSNGRYKCLAKERLEMFRQVRRA